MSVRRGLEKPFVWELRDWSRSSPQTLIRQTPDLRRLD